MSNVKLYSGVRIDNAEKAVGQLVFSNNSAFIKTGDYGLILCSDGYAIKGFVQVQQVSIEPTDKELAELKQTIAEVRKIVSQKCIRQPDRMKLRELVALDQPASQDQARHKSPQEGQED